MHVTLHAVQQYQKRFDPQASEIQARRTLVKLARRAKRHGGRGEGRGLPRSARVVDELGIVLIVVRDTIITVHSGGHSPQPHEPHEPED